MKLIECSHTHNIYKVMKEVTEVKNQEIIANSVDAAREKHVPQYEINDGKVTIRMLHVMNEDHYIEWIMVEYKDADMTKYFHPGDEIEFAVDYIPGMKLYAYCNQHGLWSVAI